MSDVATERPAWHCLVGVWRGRGSGSYPDMAPFGYIEETRMDLASGWGMLHVLQKTWLDEGDGVKGKPLHLEAGIVLPKEDGSLVYGCAQDSGRTEVMVGRPTIPSEGIVRIEWETTAHANDPRLVKLGRQWSVDGNELMYRAYLSTVRTPEYRKHLEARLVRS
jgi:hypothetical protein